MYTFVLAPCLPAGRLSLAKIGSYRGWGCFEIGSDYFYQSFCFLKRIDEFLSFLLLELYTTMRPLTFSLVIFGKELNW